MGTREVLLARKQALLYEYQRNQAKLSSILTSTDPSNFGSDTILEITECVVSGNFKWSPDGTCLLSTDQGYLHLINLKITPSKLQSIKVDDLLYAKFLSNQLILCITEAFVTLFSRNGEEIASVPCLHFDKDTSVFASYILSDDTIIIVFANDGKPDCTALELNKNQDVWSVSVLGAFAADHVFEFIPFYAKHDQDTWTIHGMPTGSLQKKFNLTGSYPVYFTQARAESFLLAICREELVLLSPSQVVKSLPIVPDWYAWTRSDRHLLVLHPQHITIIDLMSMTQLSILPHDLKDLTAAAKISVPANNPRLLLISDNGSDYFFKIKF